MGSFAALLGHATGGFEQARQEDLQRQFQDESQRRALAGELMGHIINDPSQPPDTRNAMLQSYLGMAQQGPNQKFDFKKAFQPWFDQAAKVRGQQQAAPQSPAGAQLAAQAGGPPLPPQIVGSGAPPRPMGMGTPDVSAPPAPAGVGPVQSTAGTMPNVPTPAQNGMALTGAQPPASAGAAAPSSPPPPPPELLAGIGTVAQGAGKMAEAQAQGETTGQIQARQTFAQAALNDPKLGPMIQNDPMLSTMVTGMAAGVQVPATMYGMANRTVGTGSSVPGSDLLSNPETAAMAKQQGVDPSKYYDARQLAGGRWTFTPTKGAGETAAQGGGLQTETQQHQQNVNVDYGTWVKKNATQFGQRQALLNQEFQLGVNRGYLGDANKAFVQSVQDYGTANKTMQSMDEAYKTVQQNPNNQQAQVALLMAHIGMTLGVVKGARVGKAQIEEAEDSRTMFAGAASKLNFDKDGNLDWSDPIRKGVTLTPDQMKQMVDLGHQRMGIMYQNIGLMHNQLDPTQMNTQPIGTSFGAPAASASKRNTGGPPKPPTSAAPVAHQSFADWQKSQKKAAGAK